MVILQIKVHCKGVRYPLRFNFVYDDSYVVNHTTGSLNVILFLVLGLIEVDFTGKLVLGVTMAGMIRQPGGFEYIAFGNIQFKMGITLVALPTIGNLL